MKKQYNAGIIFALIAVLFISSCALEIGGERSVGKNAEYTSLTAKSFPAYSGNGYIEINNNVPYFDSDELKRESFEYYSRLDRLGRCQAAFACLGRDLMPKEKRGDISSIKPSGWHSVKYDFVDSKSLYNRSHLIGWQLAGEDANEKNLITGTRYMNATTMVSFENLVADYIKETDNHVMYRVTPFFDGDNLIADGVLMEALSVEDDGDGVCFNVYCYNVQPGVVIDYATGESHEDRSKNAAATVQKTYVLNTGTKKFHLPSCGSISDIKLKNRQEYKGTRESLIKQGYVPCGTCKP